MNAPEPTEIDADMATLVLLEAAEHGPEAVKAVADYLARNPNALDDTADIEE